MSQITDDIRCSKSFLFLNFKTWVLNRFQITRSHKFLIGFSRKFEKNLGAIICTYTISI